MYIEHTVMPHLRAYFGSQDLGRINETCRLARYFIIHGINVVPTQNLQIAKQWFIEDQLNDVLDVLHTQREGKLNNLTL